MVGTEDVTLNKGGATGAFADKNVGTWTVQVSGLTITGTATGNYTLMQPTTTANIRAATVTASIIGNPTKPYDDTVAATLASGNYSLTGVASGESIVVTHPAGTYNNKNAFLATTVTSTALVAGDFAISGVSALLSNYVLPTTASGPGHITNN